MSAPVEPGTTRVTWGVGDRVIWPNGVEGEVCGVDFDDDTLLDECGGWHSMADCDRIPAPLTKESVRNSDTSFGEIA